MYVFRFQQTDGISEEDASQKRRRQFEPVVSVELNLRQDVGQGDAKERACRKPQGASEEPIRMVRIAQAEIKRDGSQRAEGGKESVDNMHRPRAHSFSHHDRRDRERVHRFVQRDGEHGAQSGKHDAFPM
jgi:hypothetical protein